VDEVLFDRLPLFTHPGLVFTPRATSELLVRAARAHVGDRVARIADVGTGSGAIAIAIASACPAAEVWATDTSESAVALAAANVLRHGLTGRVHVRRGDLLAPLPGRFDVVAANLPYVPAEIAAGRPELAGEPFDAVFAAGDGLAHYRRLVADAGSRLAPDGVLLLQLHGRLVTVSPEELPAFATSLAA
jgi:release factor glutamine methyltransferase